MKEFVASNGYGVVAGDGTGFRLFTPLRGEIGVGWIPEERKALREFFAAERDAELGRWRSKEHPEYVVHEHGDGRVRVMRELDGSSYSFDRESVHRFYPHCDAEVDFQRIAREFFAAHPEPKPWHDAKPGEVWVIEAADWGTKACIVDDDYFMWSGEGLPVKSEQITAGRRIWPEVRS